MSASTQQSQVAATSSQVEEQVRPRMIKDVMVERILAGDSTQEVLDAIYAEFPDANSGPKDVAWYRWRLRKDGKLPERSKLTAEERKARKAAYEADYRAKQAAIKAERRAEAKAAQEAELEARIAAEVERRLAEALKQG